MKQVILLLLLFFSVFYSLNAQKKIATINGNFETLKFSKELFKSKEFEQSIFKNNYYLWLQFKNSLTAEQKSFFETNGIVFGDYIPYNTYYVKFKKSVVKNSILKNNLIDGFQIVMKNSKYNFNIDDINQYSWAVNADFIKLDYYYHSSINFNELKYYLNEAGINVKQIHKYNYTAKNHVEVEVLKNDIQNLVDLPFTQFLSPVSAPPVLENDEATTNHRTQMLFSEFYNGSKKLTGKNVAVVIGDDGAIGPHIDFEGRIENNNANSSTANTHGDHCAGIIMGGGNFRPELRGNAPGAKIHVYDYFSDFGDMDALQNTHNVRASSHSLGQGCNAGYNTSAVSADNMMIDFPMVLPVHSAGNSGTSTCGGITGGYRTITGGYKAGKNVIAVGSVTKNDVLSSFSSKGPSADGRIKPDICAVGSNVESTQPDNGYSFFSGTSMACPAIAGTAAVLQEGYKKTHSNQECPAPLMKAIMLATADDLGNEGPDFSFGFGRVNARRAYDCIENNRFITATLNSGTTATHNLTMPANVIRAKILLYWNDPAGTASAGVALVNDLDIKITRGSTIYEPWVMFAGAAPTQASCSAPAVKGRDSLNNIEQVYIDNPVAGNYTIQVSPFAMGTPSQQYILVFEYIYDDITVVNPFGGETFVPGETQKLRWDAEGNTGNFNIEFSSNNGASWTNIATNVPSTQRYFDWVVPNVVTGQALIRVTRGTVSDICDTSFNIIDKVGTINFTEVCAGTVKLTWNAVAQANNYNVYRLGTTSFEIVGNPTTNEFTIGGLTAGTEYYFAVSAKKDNTVNGRRSNAYNFTPTGSGSITTPVITAPTSSLCLGQTILASTTSSGNLQWYRNNVPISGATSNTLTITTTGSYTVVATLGNNSACSASSIPFVVTDFTNASITNAGANDICPGTNTTLNATAGTAYQWYKDGIAINGATNSSLSVNSAGIYYAVVFSGANCSLNSNSITITLKPSPLASINEGATLSFCENLNPSLTHTLVTGTTVQWFRNGNAITGETNPSITNLQNGTYTIEVTNSDGCKTMSAPTVVTRNLLPNVDLIPNRDTLLCNGGVLKINAVSGSNLQYDWYRDGVLVATSTNHIYDATTTGTYSVTIKNTANGCENTSAQIRILLSPPPVITAGNDTTLVTGDDLQLEAKELTNLNINQFVWSPSFGLDNPNIRTPKVTNIQSDVEYTVTGKNALGCTAQARKKIKVFKGPDIYVPNAFSPINNDGLNDVLRITPIGISRFDYIRIFNRQGQMVYSSTNPTQSWDGTFKGVKLDQGVYVYVTKGLTVKGKELIKKGTILLF